MEGQASTNSAPVTGDQTGTQQPDAKDAQGASVVNAAETDLIKSLRSENAARRIKEKELSEKLKAFEDAKLSDDEKRANRIKELEESNTAATGKAKELELRLVVERAARRLGIVDEDAAFALMDRSHIVYEDGALSTQSVDNELKALLATRTWLKAPTAPNTPAVPPTNPQRQPVNTLTAADIKSMTQAEINARWDEVQRALQNGQ